VNHQLTGATVHIRIVTFRLDGITADQYESEATALAGVFTQWPGLRAKFWLADRESGIFGGVYVFESRAAAEQSRSTALFVGMTGNPAFSDLVVREFDTLAEPTGITGWIAQAA